MSQVFIFILFFSQFGLFCFYFSVCYVTVMAVLVTTLVHLILINFDLDLDLDVVSSLYLYYFVLHKLVGDNQII